MQYRLKELVRQEEREKDAKRLKEFVEDYDDERDDALYYRGRELQQRLAERVREADADSKDREKEADELAELKNKIFSGEFENPSQEYEKARREIEKLYEPRILINVNLESAQRREQEQLPGQQQEQDRRKHQQQPMADAFDILESDAIAAGVGVSSVPGAPPSEDSLSTNDDRASMADTVSNASCYSHLKNSNNNNINNNNNNQSAESVSRQNSESRDSLSHILTPTMMESDHGGGSSGGAAASAAADAASSATPPMSMPLISLTLGNNLKKKKIEATGVFVNDDDNDENINPKKRKLVPLGEYKLL